LEDSRLTRLPNHETRGHIAGDLARYFFAAVFAEVAGHSPKARDYPAELAPAHQNWSTGKFADRFRVQTWDGQSTTVTCHISKDGHYFIHPDPMQCRSLTVREAARLQTFPDNYFFMGGRTDQYVQVGNAVPPLLARNIGAAVHSLLTRAAAASERNDAELARVA
jgi:DNA (cytosine-5)-methyltransferase 1